VHFCGPFATPCQQTMGPFCEMPETQIAIDGPAAAGKSTIARLVADRLGGVYINTGDMYRAVTWVALERGIDVAAEPGRVGALLDQIDLVYELDGHGRPSLLLDGVGVPQERIRAPRVAAAVSDVARIPAVRQWMVGRQRATRILGTVVMEGRDIGTVIFPEAAHKFFLTASPEVRARRRLEQEGETAAGATVESVAADIARRDRIDSMRRVAPLRAADDAVLVDSSDMTQDQVVALVVSRVTSRDGEL